MPDRDTSSRSFGDVPNPVQPATTDSAVRPPKRPQTVARGGQNDLEIGRLFRQFEALKPDM